MNTQSQPPCPPYQGDFGNFARVGVIGKCLLISLEFVANARFIGQTTVGYSGW